ncbi:Inosine/uridine-preferring nucleoside hydrolase domain-containing protein [Pholiota molesta]|nr:Inosine/uridine-preferring nucleoside hydrolase domain-containing protein [Pholiota molesta]
MHTQHSAHCTVAINGHMVLPGQIRVIFVQSRYAVVIIDTDPGVDDCIAILLALASPELEILAFNLSYGNTDIEASYLNILKIYHTIEQHLARYPEDKDRFPNFNTNKKPILARGSAGPLEGALHSAEYFHGRDGLGDITNRHPELSVASSSGSHPYLELSSRSGTEVSLEILRSRPSRSVTYIALGPLTNLAQLMRADSELVTKRIGRVVCMGGALDVPGNTSPVAEFNFFADPYAVKELLLSTQPIKLHSGLPLDRFMLLPLDITTPHEIPFPLYKQVIDPTFDSPALPSKPDGKPILTHFTSSFLERTREIMLQYGKDAMELHDIVAVWCAIENPPFADDEPMSLGAGWVGTPRVFEIERTGEVARGMLVVDRRQGEEAEGVNRSEAQREPHDSFDHNQPGVFVVNKTPGPDVLLELLLQRVWGCSVHLRKSPKV